MNKKEMAEKQEGKKWWISWYSTEKMGAWTLYFPWWRTGFRCCDNAVTLVAAVVAKNEAEAKAFIKQSYDEMPKRVEWRFCNELEDSPFGDRFQKASWMVWK